MTTKKPTKRSKKITKPRGNGAERVRVHGSAEDFSDNGVLPLVKDDGLNSSTRLLNPETAEEREKRLAARKALTLRAFRITYENHHRRRKAS